MKAFLMGLLLVAGISAIAAVGLTYASRTAGDAFTERSNVRL
jgi:hypothetical protein